MRSNRSNVWKQMVGTKHQQKLISTSSKLLGWISFGISLVALTGFIIAMARPYKGQTQVRDKVKTRNIVIALDCSLSMLCQDGDSANTDRMNTAKAIAIKLVDAFPDDHIGVMAFAGSANMISSITIDHPSVKQTLNQIDIYSAHTLGSNFTDSVTQSIEALDSAGKSANALILITDGTEDKPDISDLAKLAKKAQVQIFTVGVGTAAGGSIPIKKSDGRVVEHKDQYGRVVITKLVDSPLRQLATETSGSYSHSSNADTMIADAVKKMDQFEKKGRVREVPDELYQWFLAPGILLLIISVLLRVHWKKPFENKATLATALLITFIIPSRSDAQENDSFAQQTKTILFEKPEHIREGYRALKSKEYALAIEHFNAALAHSDGQQHADLSLALAQAHYRSGDYTEATKAYGDAMISSDEQVQLDAQYNMGNSLFRSAVSDFNPPSDVPFDQYLEDAIRGKEGVEKLSGVDSIKKKLQESIAKYSETLQVDGTHSQSEKNKHVAQNILTSIEQIQEKIRKEEEEKKKQEEEKKDDEQKEKDSNDKEDKKKADKTEDSEEQKEKEGKEGKEKDPESMNKGEEESESEDKEKGETNKDGKPKESKSSEEPSKGDPEDLKPGSAVDPQEKGEFANEKEALKFMKQMSDQRKKPTKFRRNWRNSGNDW